MDAAVEPGRAFDDLWQPPGFPQISVAGALHSIGDEGSEPYLANALSDERAGIVNEWADKWIPLVSALVQYSSRRNVVPTGCPPVNFREDRNVQVIKWTGEKVASWCGFYGQYAFGLVGQLIWGSNDLGSNRCGEKQQ